MDFCSENTKYLTLICTSVEPNLFPVFFIPDTISTSAKFSKLVRLGFEGLGCFFIVALHRIVRIGF